MSKAHIGIIGCGKQGAKHLRSLYGLNGVRISVADENQKAAARLASDYDGVEVCGVRELLASDCDAVDICTPLPSHHQLALAALRNGMHVFCEKPLCGTSADAAELALESSRANRLLAVGYVYRFSPAFQLAKEIVGSSPKLGRGPLGEIHSAYLRLGARGSHRLWKHRVSEGGGVLPEIMVHLVDSASWLFGGLANGRMLELDLRQPERAIDGRRVRVDAPDHAVASLDARSGVKCLCAADMNSPSFVQRAEIHGDLGSLVIGVATSAESFLFTARKSERWQEGFNRLSFPRVDFVTAQLESFIKALQDSNPRTLHTASDSVELLRIMHQLSPTTLDEQ